MNVYFQYDYEPPIYIVNFYKLLQVLFGIDLGAFKYKSYKTKCVARCLCLLQCSVLSLSVVYGVIYYAKPLPAIVTNSFTLIQYVFNVFNFLFRFKDYYLKFWLDLKMVDLKLKDQYSSRRVGRLLMIWVSISLVHNIALNSMFCCKKPLWVTIVYISVECSNTVILITNSFVFLEIYYRLSFLVTDLSKPYNEAFPALQHIYKTIVDVAEKYKCAFDPVYLTTLLVQVPQGIIAIYGAFWQLQRGNIENWNFGTLIWHFYFPIVLMISTTPALIAGNLSVEARKIKVILHDKLLTEKDETKRREIERFIRYVGARPLKFTLYKVLPLDANLLGMVLHFCVTYIIVIAQFTHLY